MNQLESNRRKNIRFKTRVPEVIQLLFKKKNYETIPIHAIKVDENIKCISCILVSPFDISEGDEISYIENDGYISSCKVLRSLSLEETVFKVVFEISESD